MDTNEAPPGGHGWDYVSKNFTEGIAGPTSCDIQVLDRNLPDYRNCLVEADPPSPVPACTNGTAVGFLDTGQTSTYTCGGLPCDGCNSACNNFAPQKCGTAGGGGGSPSCSIGAALSAWMAPLVRMD